MRLPELSLTAVPALDPALTAEIASDLDLHLTRTELAPEADALARWREFFPLLTPPETLDLVTLADALSPAPVEQPEVARWLAAARPALAACTLQTGEQVQFPRISGPDTPYPDHAPLQRLVRTRVVAMKLTAAGGDLPAAVDTCLANLAFTTTLLEAQEGLMPVISIASAWQSALDGAYWLARHPALPAGEARRLAGGLAAQDGLAARTLVRAFQGEYHYVFRGVVARLPETDDPDLALSSIGSLGLAPPEPLQPGELGLGPQGRPLLDRAATLALLAGDVRTITTALATSRRFPREVVTASTVPHLRALRGELGAFFHYAILERAPTLAELAAAQAALRGIENPIGKTLVLIATPQWEPVMITVYRRDAQRCALLGLLAWRTVGHPQAWEELVAAGALAEPPIDPFGAEPLRADPATARIWSVAYDGRDDGGTGNAENTGYPPDLVWSLPAEVAGRREGLAALENRP